MTAPSRISIKSIKLDPAYAKPFNNRGAAYLRKGEYDLALQSLDQAIKGSTRTTAEFRQPCRSLPEKERDMIARRGLMTKPFVA